MAFINKLLWGFIIHWISSVCVCVYARLFLSLRNDFSPMTLIFSISSCRLCSNSVLIVCIRYTNCYQVIIYRHFRAYAAWNCFFVCWLFFFSNLRAARHQPNLPHLFLDVLFSTERDRLKYVELEGQSERVGKSAGIEDELTMARIYSSRFSICFDYLFSCVSVICFSVLCQVTLWLQVIIA